MILDTSIWLYEALNEAQHEAFAGLAERQGIAVEQRYFIEGGPLRNIRSCPHFAYRDSFQAG
ncbi:hypothetical protein EMIT0357P_20629 [Pseudomonas marginalis]